MSLAKRVALTLLVLGLYIIPGLCIPTIRRYFS